MMRRGSGRCVWKALLALTMAAGSLTSCGGTNTPPSGAITAPVEGAVLYPSDVTAFGIVGDAETAVSSLRVSFYIGDSFCSATPASDGSVSCTIPVSTEGSSKLELWVVDEENLRTDVSVGLTFRDEPPTVDITAPLEGASGYTQKTPVTFVAQVDDPDDVGLECLWSSDLDGELGSALVEASTGQCSYTETLGGGVHQISVQVTDPFGKSDVDSLLLAVLGCNDGDGDGYSLECDADCNDSDATIHPNAEELCDRKDNDCSGVVDDPPDVDGDGFTTCKGDCDDSIGSVYPGAAEVCDGLDNNCDLRVDESFDLDKDGYASAFACPDFGTDCNDNDPFTNPGSFETCDGEDNDCDSEVDEGAQSPYYADLDLDTFGDGSNVVYACSQPEGTVNNASDCDDTNPAINPQGTEACNGKDDDCDGTLDEDTTPLTFYADGDGDGYGVKGGETRTGCVAPSGFALLTGDCNDADSSINPGAAEVCDNKDNDCDTQIDEGVILTFYPDADGDGFGTNSGSTQGCTAPTGYAGKGGDCNDGNSSIYPGAVEQCDGKDNDCNGKVDDNVQTQRYYRDADGDSYGDSTVFQDSCAQPAGYVSRSGDCNDANVAINPDALEVCDTKDNDCDAQVDEGVQTQYWQDQDGDGYGNNISSTLACTLPTGYSTVNTDCNDGAPNAYPGAIEVCDGRDNDCDGQLDEGFPHQTFYKDADADGYGDPTKPLSACAAPYLHVSNNLDCNDADAKIKPGAVEVCDSKDQDCDGIVDEGTECYDDDGDGYSENQGDCNDSNKDISPGKTEVSTPNGLDDNCNGTIDEKTVCWDDDADGYIEQASVPSCPGYALGAYGSNIPQGGDCDDTRNKVYPGAPERFNGLDDDCDGTTDEDINLNAHELIFTGDLKNAQAGFAVAHLGDVNGDGWGDIGVGAPRRDVSNQNRGSAFVIFGRSTGWASKPLPQAGLVFDDDSAEARAGWAISTAGDLDDDGFDDIAIGAPYRSIPPGLNSAGRMYLLYGKATGWSSGQLATIADAAADGIQNYVLLGSALAGGYDVSGDGYHDLALGGPWPTNLAWGYLMVLPGRASRYSRSIAVGDLFKVEGSNGDALGSAMAMMPDVNDGGLADLLVAGFGSVSSPTVTRPNAGVVYFIPGSSKINPAQSTSLSALGAIGWRGDTSDELVGQSVSAAGDIDGDGYQDLLIGRGLQTAESQGQAYLVLGNSLPAGGSLQQVADVNFGGENYQCPCAVGGIGDVDGDGYSDFAVGVTKSDAGGTDAGAVYLFYGAPGVWTGRIDLSLADARLLGVPGEAAGASIDWAGDINGDGRDDFLIGAPGYDLPDGTVDAGRVFVMFGF